MNEGMLLSLCSEVIEHTITVLPLFIQKLHYNSAIMIANIYIYIYIYIYTKKYLRNMIIILKGLGIQNYCLIAITSIIEESFILNYCM